MHTVVPGEWKNKLEHQRLGYIAPDTLLEDPANLPAWQGVHTTEARQRIGAWRWRGVQEHKDVFLRVLANQPCLDFGGAAGPFGYGSVVVDFEHEKYPALYDFPEKVAGIVSSHTLEHVADLDCLLCCLHNKLLPGGQMAILVPGYRHELLQADNWAHHATTFCLAADQGVSDDWVRLDAVLARYFQVLSVAHTTDLGIFAHVIKSTG